MATQSIESKVTGKSTETVTEALTAKVYGDIPYGTITGPKGHWFWGNARDFTGDPLSMFDKTATYGRLPRLRFLNNTAWMAHYPEDVKHVLVDNQRNYIKGYGLQALKPVLGEGLLTSEPPLHTAQRRMIQPAFHRQRIAAYGDIMTEYTEAMLRAWQTDTAFDLHAEMMHLTMMIVAKCLFDADVSGSADNLGQAISNLVEAYDLSRIGPIGQMIDRFDRKRNQERSRNKQVLDDTLLRLIRERRAEMAAGGGDHGDLLSMILATSEDTAQGNTGMSDELARDELITLFIAGHETTAIALSWSFYELARHPEVEARLLAEVESVLGKRGSDGARLPTFADMEQLPYTRQVFAEAMRLDPPAYATARIALADDEIAGIRVKKGETVLVSQYVTHRSPLWWDEPLAFDPNRFTPEAEAQRARFAYFPFGGGARRCVGEPFAWMEGILILATMVQRYHLALTSDEAPSLHPRVTLRPEGGVKVIAQQR